MEQNLRQNLEHSVIAVRELTQDTYVLRFTRNNMEFRAGQHLCVGPKSDINMREYSVYSPIHQEYFEILVKEIPGGYVSPRLKKLKKNSTVKVEGPFGFFTLEDSEREKPIYFIATGTGIAPFHCFALSYPEICFNVLHGIKTLDECYEHEVFFSPYSQSHYLPCVSQQKNKDTAEHGVIKNYHRGRVTDYLKTIEIDKSAIYFLCGNCDMIYEVFDILQEQEVPPNQIKAEVYF